MTQCNYCGVEVDLPFICRYCGSQSCVDHRLPEAHNCTNLFEAKPPHTEERIKTYPSLYSRRLNQHNFKNRELRDLAITWLILSFCFSIRYLFTTTSTFIVYFGISLITLGLGFIGHELAHRTIARRFGCLAEFRLWPLGLGMALLFALISRGAFIFAAPGAVYIGPKMGGLGSITRREEGLISLAGPLANILVALGFYSLSILTGITAIIGILGFQLNMWLATFNLIPFGMMDGYKIVKWNPIIWGIISIPVWVVSFMSFIR